MAKHLLTEIIGAYHNTYYKELFAIFRLKMHSNQTRISFSFTVFIVIQESFNKEKNKKMSY